MNKVTSDIIRAAMKIGGAVLATSGFLPATCAVTDPVLAQIAGTISVAIATIWGLKSANNHQDLKDIVHGTD